MRFTAAPALSRTRGGRAAVERALRGTWQRGREWRGRLSAPPAAGGGGLGDGLVLIGRVWAGGAHDPFDGAVVVEPTGRIAYVGPVRDHVLHTELPVIGGSDLWIGPGICDSHVHLPAGADVLRALSRGGVVGVRDLGSSASRAVVIRTRRRGPAPGLPYVSAAGPALTAAPPATSAVGHSVTPPVVTVRSVGHAREVVRRSAADGADLIKVMLEDADARNSLSPTVLRAIVEAAHEAGLPVVAHALHEDMVRRAIEAGVDELAHTPTDRLPEQLVDGIAAAGISVVSTLQAFFSVGRGRSVALNAAELHRAGVRLRYGTDYGMSANGVVGVDPRELDRLADAGLGRLGALRAATEDSARAPGMRGRSGLLRVGEPAALVVLGADPLVEPGAWRAPLAVVADARLIEN